MIRAAPTYDPDAPVIVIDIGNTHTSIATFAADQVRTPLSFATRDIEPLMKAYDAHVEAAGRGRPAAVVSSVVPDALAVAVERIEARAERKPLVVGDSIPLPLDVTVTDPKAIGTDRVCQAAAAYDRIQAACSTVSFGTAVTVDLVDDDGVLLGGAIFPGIALQFRALHEHTAQLPEVQRGVPELPYGRNTAEAIQTGVCRGMAGAVRGIVEGYATNLNRWPQVVATGGDASFMQPYCDFIDRWVSHLTLRGVGLAYHKHLAHSGA